MVTISEPGFGDATGFHMWYKQMKTLGNAHVVAEAREPPALPHSNHDTAGVSR